MFRKLDVVSTVIVLVMGVGHTTMTPRFAPGWTAAAAWFSGSGLALVFLGLLNAARLWGHGDGFRLRSLCLAANALALAWIGFVVAVLPVPQAFIVLVAILGTTVFALATPRPTETER
jgi:hypothetical protein